MKLILTAFLFTVAFNAVAQKQFEGTIRYRLESSEDEKIVFMTIFYGPDGIRLEGVDSAKQKLEDEIILIRFDSGKVFTLKPSTKTYRSVLLTNNHKSPSLNDTTIAGYLAKPFRYESSGLSVVDRSYFGEPTIYAADDLHYSVPEMYYGNPQLLMIYKNKIVLAGEVPIQQLNNQWNLNNTIEKNKAQKHRLTAKALEVKSEKLDSSLFIIPLEYNYSKGFDYLVDTVDSAMALIDSTAYAPYEPSIKKKRKPSPKKSPAPIKQNALSPKKD